MTEAKYQSELIKKLRLLFPDCVILKNDPGYLQGVPDLVIFNGDRYAFLEVKASETSPTRPNQVYYVELFNKMSFADFIHPSNEEEVLSALRRALCGI
ncbi:VRR-Nuc domain protein [Streptomyces phage Kardashian]|nr:VRR-Nuc domain protein [Streptomyces phage Kardashian]